MIPYSPHPVLFEIGALKLYTYGLMVAIAFYVGIWLAARDAKNHRIKKDHIYNIGIWLVIGGILGARLFYVIQFGGNLFKVWEGGLVYYGGLLGALAAIYIYCKKHKLSFLRTTDLLAPYLALGQAIGRVGCYFKGCCYGLPMERVMPWAVDYLGALRHPTQLYSIIANLGVFAALKRIQGLKKKPGFVTASYMLVYPVVRFIIEFFRDEPKYLFGLSIAQISGIGISILGAALMYYSLKRKS